MNSMCILTISLSIAKVVRTYSPHSVQNVVGYLKQHWNKAKRHASLGRLLPIDEQGSMSRGSANSFTTLSLFVPLQNRKREYPHETGYKEKRDGYF
jgi:hypothetical protein